ncbi:uncharacterized protein TNIN_467741 [Trichonephila inaurata madagascariensis]|uniref:Uncharacterized protein n=1 Tax=Trichonephila inaurata madagascariensis TaxID=2747483 RepID=A0A8X6XQC4_9ARAC|nr:uncharacterized protein TNIN_467741 [Trichonephila inaurata madagascariensis]
MLIEKLESVDIMTKLARDDADVLIVETAIEESEHHRTAVIVGEDIAHHFNWTYSSTSRRSLKYSKKKTVLYKHYMKMDYESCLRYTMLQNLRNSMDNLRYTQFIKSTKINKPVQLSNLPSTSASAHQQINHVYYQVQTWLVNDLEPQEWCWILRDEFLEPIMTILPPATNELLNTIFCNCKNECGSRCGCRKSGLQCSSACGQYNGLAYFKAL